MVIAGLGWAVYTLSGRSARNPLETTAANFVICFPITLVFSLPFLNQVTWAGALVAVVCGALTSGLGYALWYRVLPDLQANTAPIVQLSVPVIAIFAGSLLLGETLTWSVLVAAALVVSGIALAVRSRSAPTGRS
jgi:drug/metabolite transporter (DMT)-like permease